jgi:hypothetical protein
MLFNDAQSLTFQEIKDTSAIEDKELRRTLQSLACGKVRVLNKVQRKSRVFLTRLTLIDNFNSYICIAVLHDRSNMLT